jgi:GNAT superfamily N-acetyltransferase
MGIANFAIDTGTIYGLIEAGCGTVLGFYIKPEYRRKGFGRAFFKHIENTLKADGATHIYTTPDKVTGVPFWSAMGFAASGKIDPDNHLSIYIKTIAALDNK